MDKLFILGLGLLLVLCIVGEVRCGPSCPYDCFDQGDCRRGGCVCKEQATGIYCAYKNVTAETPSGDASGFTLHAFSEETRSFAFMEAVVPPYQDCKGVQFNFRVFASEDEDEDEDDSSFSQFLFAKSFTVDLKSIKYDNVDPFCFPWIDHFYANCTACLSLSNGRVRQPPSGDDDPHYSGDLHASLSCIPGASFSLGSFTYAPPDRCSDADCAVAYDNDLSTETWNHIEIRSARDNPYIAMHTVDSQAGRYALRFRDFPPPSLTLRFAPQCQPTLGRAYEVDEDYNSREWVVFDNCGIVHDAVQVYFAFDCADPPCIFQVAPYVSYITDLAPQDSFAPGPQSSGFVNLYALQVPLHSASATEFAYNVVLQTIYSSSVAAFAEPKPYLAVRGEAWRCPSADSRAIAAAPTRVVSDTETETVVGYDSFAADAMVFLRVEFVSGACDNLANAYACRDVNYQISLVPVHPQESSSPTTPGRKPGVGVFWIVLITFVLFIALAAIGVFLFRYFKTGQLQITSEGFSTIPTNPDFLDDESEVDEVVVAEENNEQNFSIPSNTFSL